MQSFMKTAIAGLLMTSVAACSAPTIDQAGQSVKATDKVVGELMASSAQPMPKMSSSAVSVSQDVFLGGKASYLKRGQPLPTAVEREGVTLSSYTDQDIVQIADLIQSTTGIIVTVSGDAISYSNTESSQEARHPRTVPVNYTGKLSGFLNQTTAAMGLNWRYEEGEIHIFYMDTTTYVMKVLPATQSISTSIGGGAGEGDGASSQSSTSAYEVNLWDEIVTAVQGIVGGEEGGGSSVTASRSTGTLSVTAPAETLKRVHRYLEEQNSRLSQQVATNVQVFNVSMRDAAELGTDFGLDFNNDEIGNFGFASGENGVAQSGSLGWTLLRPLSGVPDVTGVVRMLNSKGDVSVVTTANATSLNNTPVPIQVGNNRSYVSSIVESVGDDGTSTEIEVSKVNTGFNMQLLPRIMSQGVVALQLNVLTNELVGANDGFEQVQIAGNTIQLPNINNRAFTQQIAIPTGNTLVLSGFEQTTSRMDKSGTGAADNWLMGGRHAGSMEREVMVILITPVIVDTGKLIERIGD
jgi:type IVB pilus formation R64 PilN family outer membrane protein